ncbi:MAG: DEAD/DEAH box helicase family protein [Chloroflexi bacterium]|nr:DEAD/DEAH box helicase family protein [Chloroflexota bacterium]
MELEDFAFKLQSLFGEDRYLRDILRPRAVLALPLISAQDFRGKFGDILTDALVIWSDGDVSTVLHSLEVELTEDYWRRARAIMQGVTPLTKPSSNTSLRADRLSDAIRLLDREIALLDDEQEKAALQIAPGPQQIRGLAGTGKTVLLAMKVANIHLHFPDRKVLFTFHTRSLYNQARSLITHFYRVHSKEDPDWSQVHIRHSWGGDTRPGVYSDLSARQGVKPMTLDEARQLNYSDPFRACCIDALKRPIVPVYDYVLVDEAQDMPNEFFQLLYRLTTEPHPITWAYDELQSLIALDIPTPEERFGVDDSGNPLVVLDDQDYPSGIEKDLVLP